MTTLAAPVVCVLGMTHFLVDPDSCMAVVHALIASIYVAVV